MLFRSPDISLPPFASSYDLLGTTDTEVSVGDIRDLFPGFILDEDSSRLKGIVKADGSLILSAYFRRGKYTEPLMQTGED